MDSEVYNHESLVKGKIGNSGGATALNIYLVSFTNSRKIPIIKYYIEEIVLLLVGVIRI